MDLQDFIGFQRKTKQTWLSGWSQKQNPRDTLRLGDDDGDSDGNGDDDDDGGGDGDGDGDGDGFPWVSSDVMMMTMIIS